MVSGTMASLLGYYEVDWAVNSEDWMINPRGCFFLSNNLVSWFN